jgi:hypothetical protein
VPRGYPGTMAPHGTLTRYTTHNCRCDECRTAATEHKRRVNGYRSRAVVDAERAAQHGTESKYTNSGCRCDACRAASAAARRSRRAADREATNAYYRAYRRRKKAA